MKHRTSKRTEFWQEIIAEWMAETGSEIIDMPAVAKWAIDNNKWKPPKYSPVMLAARELSRAAREEFYEDPQGRDVRKKHCFTVVGPDGQHRWFWVDIERATREQMHKSAQARRRMALGDVLQLHTDVSSWNDNNPHGGHIDMSYNFDLDVAEMAQPTEYPDDEGYDETEAS